MTNYCQICKKHTACRVYRPAEYGHEMWSCPRCMGVFGRHTWARLDRALHAGKRWARLWVGWRVGKRLWTVRWIVDRALHPLIYRRVPVALRGRCLADVFSALNFAHERLPIVEEQRLAEMRLTEAARSEANEAHILATLAGVPQYRRLVSSLGFKEVDIQ